MCGLLNLTNGGHNSLLPTHCAFIFVFKKDKNVSQTFNKLFYVYGMNSVSVRMCQRWFKQFRSGLSSIEDSPRSDPPTGIESDRIKALADENLNLTAPEISDNLQMAHLSCLGHLRKIGSRLDV